jgi:hypothetical protein
VAKSPRDVGLQGGGLRRMAARMKGYIGSRTRVPKAKTFFAPLFYQKSGILA